jgi:hypothetical protein
MISEIIYKLNAFDSNFVALSEIITAENAKKTPTIGELQKKHGEFFPIALEQIKLSGKVKKKLPAWVEANCLFEQRAFEQCTSQRVAQWKANYFNTSHLLSLTGGLGVDDWAWLETGAQVISTDPNKELNHLVRCNMQRLHLLSKSHNTISSFNVENSPISGNTFAPDALLHNLKYCRLDLTAEDLLSSNEFIQRIPSPKNKDYTVYLDPDRRKGDDRLGGNAKEFTPNFFEIIKTHFAEFKSWLVKLSPMTDIHFLQKELPFPIRFYSVFYQGEVKELLLELGQEIGVFEYKSIYLTSENYEIWDTRLLKQWFHLPSQDETVDFNEKNFFFESHGGLNCLGLNHSFAQYLDPVNSGKTFYLSPIQLPNSLGRSFKISHETHGSLKQIKQRLSELNIQKASLTARECKGLNASEIQKKLGLTEGGNHTIFMTQNGTDFSCWICKNQEN